MNNKINRRIERNKDAEIARCANCKTTRQEFNRMVIEQADLVNYGQYHYVCCENGGQQ
jgi:hypothetical protein